MCENTECHLQEAPTEGHQSYLRKVLHLVLAPWALLFLAHGTEFLSQEVDSMKQAPKTNAWAQNVRAGVYNLQSICHTEVVMTSTFPSWNVLRAMPNPNQTAIWCVRNFIKRSRFDELNVKPHQGGWSHQWEKTCLCWLQLPTSVAITGTSWPREQQRSKFLTGNASSSSFCFSMVQPNIQASVTSKPEHTQSSIWLLSF